MTSARPTNMAKAAHAQSKGVAKLLAVIRIRGLSGMHPKRIKTMDMLNLKRSNHATLVFDNPTYKGMLQDCKDYVTYGAVTAETVEKLLAKRGTAMGKKLSEVKKPEDIKKLASELMGGKSLRALEIDRFFRLTPPSGGWTSKKKNLPYGDLGVRHDMDAVLKRMI